MHNDLSCYVISLARSSDRRTAISVALAGISIDFEFIDAVDARMPFPPDLLARIDRKGIQSRLGRTMSNGEIACAFSHSRAYDAFLNSTASYALILEDDAILTRELACFITNGHYRARPMFVFYHSGARVLSRSQIRVFEGVDAYRPALSPAGAVGYTLDRATAKRLRAASEPLRGVADWPLDLSEIGAYVTWPMIVHHKPEASIEQSTLSAGRNRRRRRPIADYFTYDYLRRKYRKAISRRIS